MQQPNFYAIIPANVRYCKEIEMGAKLLYAEITALCQQEGYCWASNHYFSELYDVDVRTIQRWITSLKKAGFVSIEIESKSFQSSERKIFLSPEIKKMFTARQKCHPPMTKMSPPHDKNVTLLSSSSLRSEELNRIEERGSEKKEPPAKQAVAPLSADATELFSFFKQKILEKHPNIVPREKAWCEAIKGMLKADKRSIEEIKDVVSFALEDPFWVKQVQSPAGLRKESDRDGVQKYDKIYAQFASKKQKANNVAFALWMCRRIPDKLRNLDLNDSETWIKDENRGVEISTEQDEKLFREKFRTFVGRSYTEEELSWEN